MITENQSREQHLLSFKASNVLRIEAISIQREGPLTVIGGGNDQGKTSILNAIRMTLGGAIAAPGVPLRKGARKGEVTLETEDYLIEAKVSDKGVRYDVKSKNGARLPPPRAFLEQLTGGKSFDPLAYYAAKPDKQLEMLRAAVGVDTTNLDEERKAKFAMRTEVNRRCKELGVQLDSMPSHEDAPNEEATARELLSELKRRQEHNAGVASERAKLEELRRSAVGAKARIVELEAELAQVRKRLEDINEQGRAMAAKVARLPELDEAEIAKQIDDIETRNRKVREQRAYDQVAAKFEDALQESEKLTADLTELDERKQQLIESARFPLDGLGFGDGCVLYKGLPLEQASGEERIRVAVALSIARNPGLRLMLVDGGEALDLKQLEVMRHMAIEHGVDIWLTRVSDGDECTIFIKNGKVVQEARGAA